MTVACAPAQVRRGGFTLLELLLVMAILAVAVGMVSLALRDRSSQRLEEEAARLAALLEGARAHSRALGAPLRWRPLADAPGFEFIGLPPARAWPNRWLDEHTQAQVLNAAGVLSLGPEPMIGAQRVVLTLASQRRVLVTDGWGPFVVGADEPVPVSP